MLLFDITPEKLEDIHQKEYQDLRRRRQQLQEQRRELMSR